MANNGLKNKTAWKMSIFKNEWRKRNIRMRRSTLRAQGRRVMGGVLEATGSKGKSTKEGVLSVG